MDNATHSLLALMLSRAGLNRLTANSSLILVLAANVPDADIVTRVSGVTSYFCHHRGETHAWAFLPLMAVIPVLAGWLFRSKKPLAPAPANPAKPPTPFRCWGALLVAVIGVASHILLDWLNAYAVRMMLPFSGKWYGADLLFVVDPFILTILLLAIAAPLLSRLVSSEIGARRTSGQGWAIFALLFFGLYCGARWQLRERVLETLNSRIYDGEVPRNLIAVPEFASPLRWTGVVELAGSYRVLTVNLMEDFDPAAGRQFFKPPMGPAMELAKQTEAFRCFLEFNAAPLWRATPLAEPEDAVKVELFDLRFGTPAEPGFVATAEVVQGRVEKSDFQFGAARMRR